MSACPYPNCKTARLKTNFMCRGHWFKVPKELRDRIWKTFKEYRKTKNVNRLLEYAQARDEAILAAMVNDSIQAPAKGEMKNG